jgi:hypothetical protein
MNRTSLRIAVMAMALLPMASHATAAWTETVINNSAFSYAGLISDKAGNLYGAGGGKVFKLTPPKAGQKSWTQTPIYSFDTDAGVSAPLVMDMAGNLYGVTGATGVSAGFAFKLTPPATGQTAWTMTVLHTLGNSLHFGPVGGLTLDPAGNLYGLVVTTFEGDGQVYKLTRPPAGKTAWTETTLASVVPVAGDGPGVIFDKAGNLYGAEAGNNTCSSSSCGTVFKLTPPAHGNGAWTKTVIHRFTGGTDGANPQVGLLIGASGVIYGATAAGGGKGSCSGFCGTVYKLTPSNTGKPAWTETVLYRFNPENPYGPTPAGGLAFDRAGNLFGVTSAGFDAHARGTVYQLARPSGGNSAWSHTILAQFYGMNPRSGLFIGPHGAVFGSAVKANGSAGIVYQLTP